MPSFPLAISRPLLPTLSRLLWLVLCSSGLKGFAGRLCLRNKRILVLIIEIMCDFYGDLTDSDAGSGHRCEQQGIRVLQS